MLHRQKEESLNSLPCVEQDRSGVQAVQVVIDGQRFATWGDAQAFLRSNAKQITDAERTSYLDPNTYTRILRAW